MFEPLADVGRWLYSWVPTELHLSRPKLNFITVHYIVIIGWTIIASIILYGSGFIDYTDALFFAAGSSTQSGLNTININDMLLYQQVTMMLVSCVTNPVFINTCVVFVRLYWFEKRFEHVVKEIREQRRSRARTISRTKSDAQKELDLHRLELGVNGREIKVLHETTKPNGMSGTKAKTGDAEKEFSEKMGLTPVDKSVTPTPEGSNKSSGEDGEGEHIASDEVAVQDAESSGEEPDRPVVEHHLGLNPRLNREITFADEVRPSRQAEPPSPEETRLPEQSEMSKHIEFVQRQQREAKKGTALRIPGPRDFDRGEVPKEMNDDDHDLHRPQTRNSLVTRASEQARTGANTEGETALNADDHPERIRFDEQVHPARKQTTNSMQDEDKTPVAGLRKELSTIRGAMRLRRGTNSSSRGNLEARNGISRTFSTITAVMSRDKMEDPVPYLSWQATIGRNSAFLGLTEEQREELGGIEYRALKTLAKTLIIYFVGFHISGLLVNLPWILRTNPWKDYVVSQGINLPWWGIFTSASEFNDLGFTLTPDSFISFQEAVLPLLYGSFLIIIGNTGFPIMLRFVIWVASKLSPRGSGLWEELRFLLDHPRRCFTLLFPSRATWWLFWILVLLNCIDLIFFIILDLNDPAVTDLPGGYRVLNGWFQAVSTRTAGFSCVNLADLHPAIQVSYLIMMYISVFPIAISVRRTNVYEEKSLGIWGGEEAGGEDGEDPSYVGQHLRRQLSFDLWYIFLGFFIICIVEGSRLANTNEYGFTMFSVLFEIVSAYGTVGLSLGYPNIDASFSAEFAVISKLVIIAMMIRGRHRGLPYALDRAILLPSEGLQKKEAEDADRRHARRGSVFAEGHESDLHRVGHGWRDGDLDENGLPRQHLMPVSSPVDGAMTAGAGGEARTLRRRPSGVSTTSEKGKHHRSRSLGKVIAGGLSAGPTFSKHE